MVVLLLTGRFLLSRLARTKSSVAVGAHCWEVEELGRHALPLQRRERGDAVALQYPVILPAVYLSTKNRSAATTLSSAVFDRYAAGPRSFGTTFWNPGVKTEKTAKQWRKNEHTGEIWPKKKSAGRRSILEGTVPRASAFATCQSPLPGRGPRTAAGLPGRRYGEGPRIQSRGRRLLRFGSRRSMLRRCRRGSQGICIAHRNSSRSESYACTGYGVNQTAAAHRIEKHLSLSRSSCSHRSSRRPRRRGCDRRTAAAGRRSPWPQ